MIMIIMLHFFQLNSRFIYFLPIDISVYLHIADNPLGKHATCITAGAYVSSRIVDKHTCKRRSSSVRPIYIKDNVSSVIRKSNLMPFSEERIASSS